MSRSGSRSVGSAGHEDQDPWRTLRRTAALASRYPADAEDLLHDALLAAVRADRADLTSEANQRWLVGTIRHLGAMHARSAHRRRVREDAWSAQRDSDAERDVVEALARAERRTPAAWCAHPAIATLPPALRAVAQLALAGHDRDEIAWLLQLDPATLRQRIRALRKRLLHKGLMSRRMKRAHSPSA